jgi:hypothetical protein
VAATEGTGARNRYAWAAGIVFVLALAIETAVGAGLSLTDDDSAAKIARVLAEHHHRVVAVAAISVVYAAAFPIYVSRLHDLLRVEAGRPQVLGSLMLVSGFFFVALHATSDVGITGMLGAKVASYSAHHDPGVAYSLYLLTYAIDSVGDIFGSLFMFATGLLVLRSGLLPRWLGWGALLTAALLFVQAFGLGGVISDFGLVVDGIGFVLLLVFVLVSSVLGLMRGGAAQGPNSPPPPPLAAGEA